MGKKFMPLINPQDNLPLVPRPFVYAPVLARDNKDLVLGLKCTSEKGELYIVQADKDLVLYYDPQLDEIGVESRTKIEKDFDDGKLTRDDTYTPKTIKEVPPK